MNTWRPGMAALHAGERPVYVVELRPGGIVAVRPAGDRESAPLLVRASALVRPPGGARLDVSTRNRVSTRRAWTAEQLVTLRAEWARLEPEDVPRLFAGRSRAAAVAQMGLWWGSAARPRAERRLSRDAAAAALGLGHHPIDTLRRVGLLRGRADRKARRTFWTIAPAELLAFVRAHPEHCRLDRMPPSRYRDAVAEALAADPLLTLEEVGQRVGLTAASIWHRIRDGSLPAIRTYAGRGPGEHLVRSSDVARVWLERPSPHLAEAERELARRGLVTIAAAAQALGLTESQVKHRVEAGWPVERIRIKGKTHVGIRLEDFREPPLPEGLLTIADAARRVRLTDHLLYKHVREGRIRAERVPRPGAIDRDATVLAIRVEDLATIRKQSTWSELDRLCNARGLLTSPEAARRLGTTVPTIARMLRDGRLQGERVSIGRRWIHGVCPDSLDAERRAGPPGEEALAS